MGFESQDVLLAVLGVSLAIAGVLADDPWTVGLALFMAVAVSFYGAWSNSRLSRALRISLCGGATLFALAVGSRYHYLHEHKDLASYTGTLFPADNAMPEVSEGCSIAKGSMVISFGTNIAFALKVPFNLVEIK